MCRHRCVLPLQIIRPWVLVLSFRTERTDVAWAFVYKTMSDHFVLSFETLATFASRTISDRAVMRSVLTMHVLV